MFTPASHVKCKAGDAWIDKRPYRERDFSSPRTEEKRKEEKRKEKREGRENSTPSYRGKELGAAVVHLAGRRKVAWEKLLFRSLGGEVSPALLNIQACNTISAV